MKPQLLSVEIKRRIATAFERGAEIEADAISVETSDGGRIILNGSVPSWAQREEAERCARSARGVREVDNRILVSK